MVDLTRTRTREQEAAPGLNYDFVVKNRDEFVERGMNGRIVRRDSDVDWELNRMGFLKYYLMGTNIPEILLEGNRILKIGYDILFVIIPISSFTSILLNLYRSKKFSSY